MPPDARSYRYARDYLCWCGAPLVSVSAGINARTGKRRYSGVCGEGHPFDAETFPSRETITLEETDVAPPPPPD
jgi:hypothetical protein